MKYEKIFLLLFFSIFLISFASASINISQCGILSSAGETYVLNTSFTNTTAGTCINITADNITLDCQNYNITGCRVSNLLDDETISLYAIFSNSSNIIIKNCNITRFINGIFMNTTNNIIFNNNISFLYGYAGSANQNGGDTYGIYANFSNITNNFIYNLKGGQANVSTYGDGMGGGNATGIYSVYSNISFNNISKIYGGTSKNGAGDTSGNGGNATGIYLYSSVSFNNNISFLYGGNQSASAYQNNEPGKVYGFYSILSNSSDEILYNLTGGYGAGGTGGTIGSPGLTVFGIFLINSSVNKINLQNLTASTTSYAGYSGVAEFVYSNNSNITNSIFNKIYLLTGTAAFSEYGVYLIGKSVFENNTVSNIIIANSISPNPTTIGVFNNGIDSILYNNTIYNIFCANNTDDSGRRCNAFGIYADSLNISKNIIYNIVGGIDPIGLGGNSTGIYSIGQNAIIANNRISFLYGGKGYTQSGGAYGISISKNSTLLNNTIYNLTSILRLPSSIALKNRAIFIIANQSNISNNNIYNIFNGTYGACVYVNSMNNLFYNNIFNCSDYFDWGTSYLQKLNTTETPTKNIWGGSKIGGNYWTNATNNGFSDTCNHTTELSFCDTNYTIATNFIDYLPLANFTNPVSVTLVLPIDSYISSTNNINFSCNATTDSEYNITNITMYGNFTGAWTINTSNDTSSLNQNNVTLDTTLELESGYYVWNCLAWDTNNNSLFSSDNYSIIIDASNPLIKLDYPTNGSYLNTNSLTINGTASAANPSNITINNSIFGLNGGTFTSWNFTNTTLNEGLYSLSVKANNTAGTSVFTNFSFTIDRTAPLIAFGTLIETNHSNLSRNYIQIDVNSSDVNFNYNSINLYDSGMNLIDYRLNYSEYSFYNFANLSDGIYLYAGTAYDLANIINTTSIMEITLDNQVPSSTINSPDTNYNLSSATLSINITSYDNVDLQNISLFSNTSGSWSLVEMKNITSTANESIFDYDVSSFANGNYLYGFKVCDRISCNDSFIDNRTFNINKTLHVGLLNAYFSRDFNSLRFYNNITPAAQVVSNNITPIYLNFSIKDPNGVVRIYNTNGTTDDGINYNSTYTFLNVSGSWTINATTKNSYGEIATKSSTFNITDVVGYLSSYQHSTTSTEKGGNISYNLTLWHDTDECFNYSITPDLNYSNNFTIYTQNNYLMVCGSDIYHPYYNLITIFINSSSVDGLYLGNISINRTNTSTLYVSTINLTVNPPTATPYLYDSNNVYQCQNTMDGNCSWEAGNQVGVFKAMYYYVQNLGDYNATKCNLNVITNESMWDYAIDLKDFSLNVNESKKIKLDIRVTSGYGETKQAYVGITCDNSTPLGYPASTSPSNNPIIYWIIDELPQSNTGSGGGGGGGASATTPSYICDNKNMSWKAENERGGGSYSWLMMNDSLNGVREGKIALTNLFKTNTIDIKASCYDGGYLRGGIKTNDSNICEYIKIDKTTIKLLPTAESQYVNFYVNISTAKEYKLGDKIYASILLKDVAGCEYYFPITVTMSSQASALSLTALVNKLFNQCKMVSNVCIPYWSIFLVSLIAIAALVMIILLSLKVEYYAVLGILSGFISSIIILLLI